LKFLLHVFLWLNICKMDLWVGKEARVAALTLPSGLILELDHLYFVIALSRNIVSIFIIKIKCCSFYNNNVYYGSVIFTNVLYIHDLKMSMFNINCNNKLDNQYPNYLWQCRLCHINETRIIELYKEKYLIRLIINYIKLVYWVK
jgi:hypothetical protein